MRINSYDWNISILIVMVSNCDLRNTIIRIIACGVIIYDSLPVMAVDSDSMSSQQYFQNLSDIAYPNPSVYIGSKMYTRIAEPIADLAKLSAYEFKLVDHLAIFGITERDGIVYVKDENRLKQLNEPYVYLTIIMNLDHYVGKEIIILVKVLPGKELQCNPTTHCSDLHLDTQSECTSSCETGSISKCQWRKSPSPDKHTANYSTCTPDINSCPNGFCDSLEKMHHLICPQDCAAKNEIFGTGMAGKISGISSATGVCTCDEFAKCTCEKKVKVTLVKKTKPTTTTTSTTPTLMTDTLCNGYWCDRNVNISITLVILFVTIVIVVFYCRKKILNSNKRTISVRKLDILLPKSNIRVRHQNPASNTNTCITDFDHKWEFPRNKLFLQQEIGAGEFGKVLKAQAVDILGRKGISTVAVKTIKTNAGPAEKEDLLSEYNLLKDVNHPNVVKLLGACTTKGGPFYLIIEYAKHGSLRSYLRKSRIQDVDPNGLTMRNYDQNNKNVVPVLLPLYPISPKDILKFAWQISKGMAYLAELKLVHRDLAARNVLLTENKMCKISDFGMTRDVYEDNTYLKKTKGRVPVKWLAPESMIDRIYTSRSDVWSFGIVLWELVTLGAVPYPGIATQDLFKLLKEGYRMAKPENCSSELYDIMVNCWADDQYRRPNFKSITTSLEEMLEKGTDYLQLDFKQFVNNMCYLMDDYEVLDKNQIKPKGIAAEDGVTYEIPKPFNELGTTYVMMKDFTFEPEQQQTQVV